MAGTQWAQCPREPESLSPEMGEKWVHRGQCGRLGGMTRPKPGRRPQYGPALHKLCPSWPSAVPGGGQASEWGPWAPGTRSRAGARAGPESTDGSRPVRPAPAAGFVSSSPPRNTASLRPKAVACASKDSRGKRRPARLCRVPVLLVFLPSWTCSFLVTSLPPAALLAAAPSPESTCALPAARKADSESGLGAPHSPPQRCAPPPPAPAGRLGRSTAVSRVPSRPWLLSRRCLRFSAVGWLRFVVVVVSVYPLRCPPRSSDA